MGTIKVLSLLKGVNHRKSIEDYSNIERLLSNRVRQLLNFSKEKSSE